MSRAGPSGRPVIETQLRTARLPDAAALARLGAETFTETFGHLYVAEDLQAFLLEARSSERYARCIADPDVLVTVAEDRAGALLGYAVAGPCKLPLPETRPDAGEVRELYVLGAHQGRRLGTQLLEGSLEWLALRDRAPLYVGVWSENVGAQRLYARYGFHKVGEYDFPVGRHIDREFILERA